MVELPKIGPRQEDILLIANEMVWMHVEGEIVLEFLHV